MTALACGVRRVLEVLLGEPPTSDLLGTPAERRAPDVEALLSEMRRVQGM